jgi:hypothetical protein
MSIVRCPKHYGILAEVPFDPSIHHSNTKIRIDPLTKVKYATDQIVWLFKMVYMLLCLSYRIYITG